MINVNATNTRGGSSILYWVIRSDDYSLSEKREIIDRIINLRGQRGELIFDIRSDTSGFPPLAA